MLYIIDITNILRVSPMKKVIFPAVLVALTLLPSCASRANGIAPLAVDASEYYDLNCSEARSELATTREREASLARQQNNAATGDAVGVFLLAIPASSLLGGDVAGELALAKGQVRALETAVRQKCRAEAQMAE